MAYIPLSYTIIIEERAKAGFIIGNKQLKPITLYKEIFVVAIQIIWNEEKLNICTMYCPPSKDITEFLYKLDALLVKHSEPWVITADFNAKSKLWDQDDQDPRGSKLLELILRHQLEVLNNPFSLPTFSATIGTSWVDVALISPNLIWNTSCIVKDEITASDHNLLEIIITIENIHIRENKINWEKLEKSMGVLVNTMPLEIHQDIGKYVGIYK